MILTLSPVYVYHHSWLRSRVEICVRGDPDSSPSNITVDTFRVGKHLHQTIQCWPKDFFVQPDNSNLLDTNRYRRATFGAIKGGAHPALWVLLGTTDNGVYDFCELALLRWSGASWKLTPLKGHPQFSPRGDMLVKGSKIVTWDVSESQGRMGPAKYQVEKYRFNGYTLVKYFSKETRKYYQPQGGSAPVKAPLARKDDPLREFGFRWP